MTIINPNSIAGITSVTAQADIINFYKSNGNQAGLGLNGVNFNTTAGISTFNNLVVGGVLTYEDVKNVDSIGIITARAGINLTGGNITLGDSGSSGDDRIHIGAGNDIQLYHYSGINYIDLLSNTEIRGSGSTIKIKPKTSEEGIIIVPDGSVSLYYDNDEKLATGAVGVYAKSIMPSSHETYDLGQNIGRWNNLYIADNGKLRIGQGDDLQIYHDSSHSILKNSTGYLRLMAGGSGVTISNADNSETMAAFIKDGAVDLYHNNSKKFETTAAGITVSGHIDLDDSNFLKAGTGDDLWVGHDGSHSYINHNGTGDLFVQTDGGFFVQKYGTTERLINANSDGAVELFYNGTKRCETTSSGFSVPGGYYLDVPHDSGKIRLGASNDLEINHNGSRSNIKNVTGDLFITNTSGQLVLNGNNIAIQSGDQGETLARFLDDGACELWYNNTKHFETKDGGAIISRNANSGCNLTVKNDNNSQNAAGANIFIEAGDNCNTGAILRLEQNGAYHDLESRANGNFYIGDNGTHKAYLDSSGNFGINDGNLQVASGHGIDFSATADGSGGGMWNELLSDYEVGSFTPVTYGWTTATPYGGSNYNTGWYVKVGNICHVGWKIYYNGLSGSYSHIGVGGFPFIGGGNQPSIAAARFDVPETAVTYDLIFYMGQGDNKVWLYHKNSSGTISAINASGNRSNCWTMGQVTYYV